MDSPTLKAPVGRALKLSIYLRKNNGTLRLRLGKHPVVDNYGLSGLVNVFYSYPKSVTKSNGLVPIIFTISSLNLSTPELIGNCYSDYTVNSEEYDTISLGTMKKYGGDTTDAYYLPTKLNVFFDEANSPFGLPISGIMYYSKEIPESFAFKLTVLVNDIPNVWKNPLANKELLDLKHRFICVLPPKTQPVDLGIDPEMLNEN